MYNRYIPGANGHTRIAVEEDAPTRQKNESQATQQKHTQSRQPNRGHSAQSIPQDIFRNLTGALNFSGGEDKNAGMAGILKSLHLEDLDSGDVLLLLIILLLFLEGDNLELVITLGLMLLLGLGEDQKE